MESTRPASSPAGGRSPVASSARAMANSMRWRSNPTTSPVRLTILDVGMTLATPGDGPLSGARMAEGTWTISCTLTASQPQHIALSRPTIGPRSGEQARALPARSGIPVRPAAQRLDSLLQPVVDQDHLVRDRLVHPGGPLL